MNSGRPVVRIAHAYGNRRATLLEALAADVDVIEADVLFRGGRIEVRHEKRLGWLPLVVDRRRRGVRYGPWAVQLPRRHYVRLDVGPLPLGELLKSTSGHKRLLLDVKAGDPRPAEAFTTELIREIEAEKALDWVAVCGQFWPVLDRLQETAPELEVRYSMQDTAQWDMYVRRLERGEVPSRVSIQHRLLDDDRGRFLAGKGVDAYCWTVDDAEEAQRLVERGVDGIISNDLGLFAGLR